MYVNHFHWATISGHSAIMIEIIDDLFAELEKGGCYLQKINQRYSDSISCKAFPRKISKNLGDLQVFFFLLFMKRKIIECCR